MVHSMNMCHRVFAPADPASHEPSEARRESCTCCGHGREPDPTDDFMRMLKRLAHLGMEMAERRAARDAVQAEAPAAPSNAPDQAALALHRLTSLVRLSMALSIKFHTDRLEREKQGDALQATAERQRKTRLKTQLKRLVEQAIEHQADQAREKLIESELGDEQIGRAHV